MDARREEIARNIATVRGRIEQAARRSRRDAAGVKLIAVSKNFDSATVRAAFACGMRDFGENRVQEAEAKYGELADIRSEVTLHMIGHLQTNKAKEAINIFDIIHSVDSVKLAKEISSRAQRTVPILIEVNVADEESKFGLSAHQLKEIVGSIGVLPNLDIRGLMTVAPYVEDPEEVRGIFSTLKKLNEMFGFRELSMGMTDDLEVAIEEGSTMIRVGRAIFGERRY